MIWNNIQDLTKLKYCPWCKEELENKIQITKTNRKKIECNCGCTMFESNKRLWYKIELLRKEEVNNTAQWYEYKEKDEVNAILPTSSGGNRCTK